MIYLIENKDGDIIQEERFTQRASLHNERLLYTFLETKRLEGLSNNTLNNYRKYLQLLSEGVGKRFEDITVVDLRQYMTDYQSIHKVKNETMDNIRRVYSSFYNFLEDEEYILRSPVKKLHKIKGEKTLKQPFTDEDVIQIFDACYTIRERALIDFLYITGVRVSELCKLNISDIDFERKEVIVMGKGSKERVVYFDAQTKLHLEQYLETRKDENPALFVAALPPHNRISKTGVEFIVSQIGDRAHVPKCHPHRFRRTLATRLLNRGVPIEQVQQILGHSKIETTLIYAQVDQGNVKLSHGKFA